MGVRRRRHHFSREEAQAYWRSQANQDDRPQSYLVSQHDGHRVLLVDLIKRHMERKARILELGCSVGANLHYLFSAGFRNLSGVEINPNAVRIGKSSYAEIRDMDITVGSIEETIRGFHDGDFDLIFTMAVLEHIHTESDWVFPEIARVTRDFLITIEDEERNTLSHFPRNYRHIFGRLGMREVECMNCEKIQRLGNSFYARVFRKRTELTDDS